MKPHHPWWILIAGIVIVLSGVTLRIDERTFLSSTLILSGIILEITAFIFLLRKVITRNKGK